MVSVTRKHFAFKKAIQEWIDKPFTRNKKLMVIFWNAENPNHEITDSYLD